MKTTGERAKLMRSLRQESRRFRLIILVIGFFLVTLTFIVVSKPEALLSINEKRLFEENSKQSIIIQQSAHRIHGSEEAVSQEETFGSQDIIADELSEDPRVVEEEVEAEQNPKLIEEFETNIEPAKKEENEAEGNPILSSVSSDTVDVSTQSEQKGASAQPGDDENEAGEGKERKLKVTLPTVSNYTIKDSSQSVTFDNVQEGLSSSMEMKKLCDFSNFRADICEMEGDVVVHPNSSSIIFKVSPQSERNEEWKIKPYPRKGDEFCLSQVRELTVKSGKAPPQCTRNHNVPAIIFSITGYTGNLFHDFTDVIVPLFTTAKEFNGEVQFLITDMQIWWTIKYQKVLQKLSNYDIIDFNNDDQVHCFKRVIVGTRAYKEFTIDADTAPNHYSMVDFNRFMREAYSLGRASTTLLGADSVAKPRLLIISRKRSRMFTNINEIVAMAEDLGYEVMVNEADVITDLTQVAQIVNSCDVMMGVHGAGLTNCVFLPPNGTLIQVVPWGGLDWIARLDFGQPSESMGLRYTQYSITVDESTLTEQYPRDHDIFKNPLSFHSRGFHFIRTTFMDNQNVRLDINRFRSVLLEALNQLNP